MSDTTTPAELKSLLDQGRVTLLDVRRAADRDGGGPMIGGAQWRDPEQVEQWAGELAPERPVVIYCVRGGSVSASVQGALRERRIDVRFLEGGLAAWEAQGAKEQGE